MSTDSIKIEVVVVVAVTVDWVVLVFVEVSDGLLWCVVLLMVVAVIRMVDGLTVSEY